MTSLSTSAGPASASLAQMQRAQVLLVAQLISRSDADTPLDPVVAEALAQAINGAVESTALWWKDHPELSAEALAQLLTEFLSPGLLALSQRRTRSVARPRRKGRP